MPPDTVRLAPKAPGWRASTRPEDQRPPPSGPLKMERERDAGWVRSELNDTDALKVFLAAASKDGGIREEEEGGAKRVRRAGTLLFLSQQTGRHQTTDGTKVGPDGICGELAEPRTKQAQQRPD